MNKSGAQGSEETGDGAGQLQPFRHCTVLILAVIPTPQFVGFQAPTFQVQGVDEATGENEGVASDPLEMIGDIFFNFQHIEDWPLMRFENIMQVAESFAVSHSAWELKNPAS